MAFTVEDGTGLIDADSYASVQEYRDYAEARGIDVTLELDATVQGYLVRATDYVDLTYEYNGTQTTDIQALEFPRTVDDINILLPIKVKKATIEMALEQSNGATIFTDSTKNIQAVREKVGPIETETKYDTSTMIYRSASEVYPIAHKLLKPYITIGSGNSGQIPTMTG